VANSSPDPEFDARIRDVDSKKDSPTQRAERVWRVISTYDPDLTTWDVLCFCAEFSALIAQRYHWILPVAKRFVSLIYSAHYYDEDRTDKLSDRITKSREPVDSSDRSNASPKSLFDLHRTDATGNDSGGRNTSPESPLHVRDSASTEGEKSSPPDAGQDVVGDASSPS
jgi:hypothetical protein